ncbi:prepilin-type N-terminal cleavage/methylation domain-containing protein [Candidatus Sumerlaeota bacterium]|nr:prepilin-type N-terminal cleavage/methylation domain-containing protein [Candidatus Sumerlaeota bacterium]
MRQTGAFTLIELLVVVAIIAILAAIALPNFLEAQTRAKISRVKSDLRTIAVALELYAVDHNAVPPDYDGLGFTAGQGEWRTYRDLTTPVAYFTFAPTDLFREDTHGLTPGGHDYFEFYGLNPAMFPTSFAVWSERGVKWFAYSFGPDRDNDRLPLLIEESSTLRIYDPTNGTVSSGDIGRSNIGPYPE